MIEARYEDVIDDVPAQWIDQPHRYVDMNPMHIVPDPHDPENLSVATIHFPIVDPRADAEGFSYSRGTEGVVPSTEDLHSRRLPMPVEWLYVLEDGTIGSLDEANRFVSPQREATRDNPIVGRIAFWADDNTCKINVNTASEGIAFDSPRASTTDDIAYAKNQPRNGEFQRYPGHPAMVSLSSVLFPGNRLDPTNAADLQKLEAIWELAAAIGTGGSNGGTTAISASATPVLPTPSNYHLYSSIDEVMFQSSLDSNHRRLPHEIDKHRLSRSQFFLTAHSSAPEMTPYGTPRILMWPVHVENSRTTPFDRVMRHIGTTQAGPKEEFRYFIQRNNPTSRHNDFFDIADERNVELWDYLKNITESPLPGYSSSFGTKYGSGRFDDRDQIAGMMLDAIRGVNLYDGNLPESRQYTPRDSQIAHGQIAGYCFCGGSHLHRDRWANSARRFPKGIGRILTCSEFALIFSVQAERTGPDSGLGEESLWRNLSVGEKLVEPGLIIEGFAPAQGWTSLLANNSIQIGGGTGNDVPGTPPVMSINGTPLELSRSHITTSSPPKNWIPWGGSMGVRCFNRMVTYDPIVVPAGAARLDFSGTPSGTPLRVIVYDRANTRNDVNNLVQSYQLQFPQASFPVPQFSGTHAPELADRMRQARNAEADRLIDPSADVVQSLVPNHGDYRLVAAKRVISPDLFAPHPEYGLDRMAHALVEPTGPLPGATFSQRGYVAGASYPEAIQPDFPIGPDDPSFGQDARANDRGSIDPFVTGDWAGGYGPAPDGAYTNKADDGDIRGPLPYFSDLYEDDIPLSQVTFSPNRQIPSPISLFGSLPSGVQKNIPWQTLLFRPQPDHFGSKIVPDHLWLEMFWMPIVEPYVISTPFESRGKINMNYHMFPFTYITRATALHALMKSEKLLALKPSEASSYKEVPNRTPSSRYHIDIDETLLQWEKRFARGRAFRSPSEITEMYLVPEGERLSDMEQFWADHALTGDNIKEQPYGNLYPRLTTRSNTYQVHIVAQRLKKVRSTDPAVFDPKRDQSLSEYRGSAIVERSINPNDPDIPDYAKPGKDLKDLPHLDSFYTFRTRLIKQFAP